MVCHTIAIYNNVKKHGLPQFTTVYLYKGCAPLLVLAMVIPFSGNLHIIKLIDKCQQFG